MDLRKHKYFDLTQTKCLKDEVAYLYEDEITGKKLVIKLIGYYDDSQDEYLVSEYQKLYLLSSEPEIGTVYYLAKCNYNSTLRSCYIMDYVIGQTLGNFLKNNSTINYDNIIDIILQLACGLEKSHNYEISHGDLHSENIIIDEYGYVKIIDFAFWGKKVDHYNNINYDIKCFNEIVEELINKGPKDEEERLKMISNHCKNIKSFKSLKNNLEILNEISFDYCLLDDHGKAIISKIINALPYTFKLSNVLTNKNIDINSILIPEITAQEKEYYEQNQKPNILKYMDTRIIKIQENIEEIFRMNLHQLKQAGLIDWDVYVTNIGEDFLGPYKLTYQIKLTPKLLKWKKSNSIFNFLKNIEKEKLEDLLLTMNPEFYN